MAESGNETTSSIHSQFVKYEVVCGVYKFMQIHHHHHHHHPVVAPRDLMLIVLIVGTECVLSQ